MKIGIIGSGNIGGTAAKLFLNAGHEIAVSNSIALTDRDTFVRILQLDGDSLNSTEYRDITVGRDNNYIVDYFMEINNYLNVNELRFY